VLNPDFDIALQPKQQIANLLLLISPVLADLLPLFFELIQPLVLLLFILLCQCLEGIYRVIDFHDLLSIWLFLAVSCMI